MFEDFTLENGLKPKLKENNFCMFSNEFEDEGWNGDLHRFVNWCFNDELLTVGNGGLLIEFCNQVWSMC